MPVHYLRRQLVASSCNTHWWYGEALTQHYNTPSIKFQCYLSILMNSIKIVACSVVDKQTETETASMHIGVVRYYSCSKLNIEIGMHIPITFAITYSYIKIEL